MVDSQFAVGDNTLDGGWSSGTGQAPGVGMPVRLLTATTHPTEENVDAGAQSHRAH